MKGSSINRRIAIRVAHDILKLVQNARVPQYKVNEVTQVICIIPGKFYIYYSLCLHELHVSSIDPKIR